MTKTYIREMVALADIMARTQRNDYEIEDEDVGTPISKSLGDVLTCDVGKRIIIIKEGGGFRLETPAERDKRKAGALSYETVFRIYRQEQSVISVAGPSESVERFAELFKHMAHDVPQVRELAIAEGGTADARHEKVFVLYFAFPVHIAMILPPVGSEWTVKVTIP